MAKKPKLDEFGEVEGFYEIRFLRRPAWAFDIKEARPRTVSELEFKDPGFFREEHNRPGPVKHWRREDT